MLLPNYIEKVGPVNLAKKLRVSRQNIYAWQHLKQAPKLTVAYKLIMLSRGELNFDAIYLPYLKKKLRGKKFSIGDRGRDELQLEFKF